MNISLSNPEKTVLDVSNADTVLHTQKTVSRERKERVYNETDTTSSDSSIILMNRNQLDGDGITSLTSRQLKPEPMSAMLTQNSDDENRAGRRVQNSLRLDNRNIYHSYMTIPQLGTGPMVGARRI